MFRVVRNGTPSIPARVLGNTGVNLPILGFGTAPTGLRLNTGEAVRLYETVFHEGMTCFDGAGALLARRWVDHPGSVS